MTRLRGVFDVGGLLVEWKPDLAGAAGTGGSRFARSGMPAQALSERGPM